MDQGIINEFVTDSLEHLDRVEPCFLAMESEGARVDPEVVNAAFRAIHSIKGSSALAGVRPVRDLSHAMESLMIRFRDQSLQPKPEIITVLLGSVDKLRLLITNALGDDEPPSYEQELAGLKAVLGEGAPEAAGVRSGRTSPVKTYASMAPPKAASAAKAKKLDLACEIKRMRAITCQAEAEEDREVYQVLLVEDDKFTARMLRDRIAAEDRFTPVVAGSLAEAAEIIEHGGHEFFVAVLDLTLPDAPDGEIVDYVIGHGIPPIILTATFSDEVRQRLLAKQAIDYLLKGGAADVDYLITLLHRLRKNQHIKALVVDDSRAQRRMLVSLLELLNFQVVEAEDGREALEIFKAHPEIKLVITDYNMPNMDGLELAATLRASHGRDSLSIIGLSSEATATLSAGFLKGGANDFLPKPYTKEEIYSRIILNLELQENICRIRESSQRDYLTGLPNRRHFFSLAEPMLAGHRQQGQGLALAMMDIDFFKKVNDTYGHAAGDEVLKNVARALMSAFGEIGPVARLGGEEFAAVIPGVTPAEALVLFNEVRKIIERSFLEWDGQELRVTVSVGVATEPLDNVEQMIKQADERLYVAKQQGRNRVVVDSHHRATP